MVVSCFNRSAARVLSVIPAKAGIQCLWGVVKQSRWIPAFAGMTVGELVFV